METEHTLAAPQSAHLVEPALPGIESQTYSVIEAAQVLGVSMPTIYRLISRRLFRPLPHMRHKRIPKRQLDAYLNGTLQLH